MARNLKLLRNGAVLVGVGALLAAAATPGAVAQSQSNAPATAAITRALLTQADAGNKEIVRQLLVTQIQVDGSGPITFDVPVVEGPNPKNMDGFGGPTVENGQAVYNLDVSGPETFRTQQDGTPVKVPVKLTVKAKLNGKPIDPTELKNVTGDVELAYTAENLTSTPTTLFYENGNGDPVEEKVDIKTSMGGTLEITFPPSWSNFVSPDSEVISGDGSGETLVSGGFTLMEPFGEPTGTITIKAKVTNGSMPPAVLQFLVLEPKDNPTARALSEQLAGGKSSGQDIFAGGKTLDEGADQLIEGLTTAVDGAIQIADGVEFTLLDGVNRLWESFSEGAKDKAANADTQLVDTVRGEQAYQDLLGGFDTVNSTEGLFKVQGILKKVIDQLGAPFDPTKDVNGKSFSPGSQTANSMLSTLLWGAPGLKRPNPLGDALGPAAALVGFVDTPQRGITMPDPTKCDLSLVYQGVLKPKNLDIANPCGIVQLIQGTIDAGGLTGAQKAYLTEAIASLVPSSVTIPAVTPPVPAEIAGKTVFTAVNSQPGGCLQGAAAGYAYKDPYGCNYSPQNAAAGLVLGKTDVSTLIGALGISLGKGPVTTGGPFNPTLQVDPSFTFSLLGVSATYTDTLKFGVCPGPEAPEDAVSTHCSAAQVLSFLAAGVSGNPANGFTQTTNPGPIISAPSDSASEATIWSDPVYGEVSPNCVVVPNSYPPKTIPPAPDTETEVVPFGLSCAVRTLQSSLNNILLPTIAVGVQEQTVDSLGNGVYSPDCDPDKTPTLTCGLSAIRAGIIDPLQPGTRQLADGLPAALDGVKKVKTDGAGELMKKGDEAAQDYGRKVALYEAMNNPDLVSKYIPGGAPTGEDVVYNGVYKFELAGVGSQGTSTGTNLALGVLGLLAAIGAGAFAASRRKA